MVLVKSFKVAKESFLAMINQSRAEQSRSFLSWGFETCTLPCRHLQMGFPHRLFSSYSSLRHRLLFIRQRNQTRLEDLDIGHSTMREAGHRPCIRGSSLRCNYASRSQRTTLDRQWCHSVWSLCARCYHCFEYACSVCDRPKALIATDFAPTKPWYQLAVRILGFILSSVRACHG